VTTGTDVRKYRIMRFEGSWWIEQSDGKGGWEMAESYAYHEDAKAAWWKLIHPRGRRRSLGQVQPDSQPASLPQAP
jgi:hypothetical protein